MMVTGIVICHGQLAFELLNVAGKILGPAEAMYAFSNENLSPEVLYAQVQRVLRDHQIDQGVAMVDLHGGSCWTVARMLTREFPRLRVISGVNVSMVISFLSKRGKIPFEELLPILERDARRGIVVE